MLIILVVGRYNMQGYCDRWLRLDGRELLLIGSCSTAQGKIFLSYWASRTIFNSKLSLCHLYDKFFLDKDMWRLKYKNFSRWNS
jgi:hypothetical protein